MEEMNVRDLQLVAPLLDIRYDIPGTVIVLHHKGDEKYACFTRGELTGLCYFSVTGFALEFARKYLSNKNIEPLEITFDKACELAKSRPNPVVALILCDNMMNPVFHYVK
jgi:hypothetical protein